MYLLLAFAALAVVLLPVTGAFSSFVALVRPA